jgi:hypothetical protein
VELSSKKSCASAKDTVGPLASASSALAAPSSASDAGAPGSDVGVVGLSQAASISSIRKAGGTESRSRAGIGSSVVGSHRKEQTLGGVRDTVP